MKLFALVVALFCTCACGAAGYLYAFVLMAAFVGVIANKLYCPGGGTDYLHQS